MPIKPTEKGVPEETREQLARDIAEAGGTQNFDEAKSHALEEILNSKPLVHKDKNHPLRKKLRNLVSTQWKVWPHEKHLELVNIPFGICSPSTSSGFDRKLPNRNTIDQVCEAPTPTPKEIKKRELVSSDKTKQKETMTNKLGKKVVVRLPKGLFFCIVWVDSKLSNVEPSISKDGCSVVLKSCSPNPASVRQLLSHCAWAADEDNVITSTVDEVIRALKPKPMNLLTVPSRRALP